MWARGVSNQGILFYCRTYIITLLKSVICSLSIELVGSTQSLNCFATYLLHGELTNTKKVITTVLSYFSGPKKIQSSDRHPQDAGMYDVARQTLDEGQAYTSIPTQQKVLEKVNIYFCTI